MFRTSLVEKYRLRGAGPAPHYPGDTFGFFQIPLSNTKMLADVAFPSTRLARKAFLNVMAVDGTGSGWDHVSAVGNVATALRSQMKVLTFTPTWTMMCYLKELFWEPDDVVIQFHPRRRDYVNVHPNTLHLWRPLGVELPMPPREFV